MIQVLTLLDDPSRLGTISTGGANMARKWQTETTRLLGQSVDLGMRVVMSLHGIIAILAKAPGLTDVLLLTRAIQAF